MPNNLFGWCKVDANEFLTPSTPLNETIEKSEVKFKVFFESIQNVLVAPRKNRPPGQDKQIKYGFYKVS